MKFNRIMAFRVLTVLAFSTIVSSIAYAGKPSWAGNGKHHDKGRQEHYTQNSPNFGNKGSQNKPGKEAVTFSEGRYFIDSHRYAVRDYYYHEYQGGHCPPGLAKKHNGCMAPGQTKQWAIGQALPRNIVHYDLPPAVLTNMGPPPPGYRYVRVASDILMIAVGSSMVMDAIRDLGGWY